MKPMQMFVTQKDREAEIVRLMAMGLIALGRLFKSIPQDWEPADTPPDVTKPTDLRRLAARMRAGFGPRDAVNYSAEDVEIVAKYQKRAVYCRKKMRALEARLKPLWAAEEADSRKQEQNAFHEAKSIAAAEPDSGMAGSYRTMKRAFRKRVGRP